MKRVIPLILLVLISGCATGTHIITGHQRPPTSAEQVQLYPEPPEKYEVIGLVNAQFSGRWQWNMDKVVTEIKKQAALIGANGIILGDSPTHSGGQGFAAVGSNGAVFVGGSDDRIQMSGKAVWVTKSDAP